MKNANLAILLGVFSAPFFLPAQPANPAFPGAQQEGSKGMTSASNTEATDPNHSLDTPPITIDKKNRTVADQTTPHVVVVPPTNTTSAAAVATAPATTPPVKAVRLDSTALTEQIRRQPAESREALLTGLDTRLESTEQEIAQVRRSSTSFSGTPRETFEASFADYKEKQKALKHSLQAAHEATAANWSSARTTLAQDFEAYSLALAKVEANSAIDR